MVIEVEVSRTVERSRLDREMGPVGKSDSTMGGSHMQWARGNTFIRLEETMETPMIQLSEYKQKSDTLERTVDERGWTGEH